MIDRRWLLGLALLLAPSARADGQKFERIVIDADFPSGYQIEVADVNGDGKPDLIGVGGGTCAWYENPSWKKRIVSGPKDTPDIISSATADLDGDGRAEIAIAYDFAMNEPKRGKLTLAIQGAKVDEPWTFRRVEDAPSPRFLSGELYAGPTGFKPQPSGPRVEFPSIHRIRWGRILTMKDIAGSFDLIPQFGLIAAPIFGPSARPPLYDQEPASLSFFGLGPEPKSGRWRQSRIGQSPVLHAIEIIDLGDPERISSVIAASNEGVTLFRLTRVEARKGGGYMYWNYALTPGSEGPVPRKGASEVHLGRLKDGGRFLATVEPWHGTDVVVYSTDFQKPIPYGDKYPVGPRTVIDTTLKEGHALWVADVDGDGDDEVFAGYRGGGGGVLMYDKVGADWVRTVLDGAMTAQDLRGGDLDGDGVPDVVAIGGQSHNVVWYRPIRGEGRPAAK